MFNMFNSGWLKTVMAIQTEWYNYIRRDNPFPGLWQWAETFMTPPSGKTAPAAPQGNKPKSAGWSGNLPFGTSIRGTVMGTLASALLPLCFLGFL
jgi:hypothetical protein